MNYFLPLSLACLCMALSAEVETPAARPTEKCPSCEKGTSRLAALQGQVTCPESCEKLCCTGKSVTLVLPALKDQKSADKIVTLISDFDGAIIDEHCLNTHCATIKYDSEKITKLGLIQRLIKLSVEVSGEKLSYNVAGMTCSGCSGKLTEILFQTPGVIKVETVSHETKSASIVIDPTKTDGSKIVQIINETGYKVVSP